MNLKEILDFHNRFKAKFHFEPVYTGSFCLFLKGYLDELPSDMDIVLDSISFDLLENNADCASYDEDEHFSFKMYPVKVDVFLDKEYDKEEIDFFNEKIWIVDPKYPIDAKKKYITEYLDKLAKGEVLNSVNYNSFLKHVRHINTYNKRQQKTASLILNKK